MLTDGMLDFYREHIGMTYPDQCVLVRTAGSADGMGGITHGTTVAGTYACRVAPAYVPPFERLNANQVQSVDVYTITFEALTDIHPSDNIHVGSRVFHVTGGSGDRSWEISKRINAVEINEDAT